MLKRSEFCPMTGLPVDGRPGWHGQSISHRLISNFSIVGRSVLYSAPVGRAGLEEAKASLELYAEVVAAAGDGESPFVLIEDLADFSGIEFKARQLVFERFTSTSRLLGVVFCNASTLMEIMIRLARRLERGGRQVVIAGDYQHAISEALAICAEHGVDPGPSVFGGPAVRFGETGRRLDPVELLTDDDWTVETDEFRNSAMLVDGRILHSVSEGRLTEEVLPRLDDMRFMVKAATTSPTGLDYIVVDSRGVAGASRNVRLAFLEGLKGWHRHSPILSYVMYGVGPFLRTALRMARPFMPFRMEMVRDLGEVFAAIRADTSAGVGREIARSALAEGDRRSTVDELLAFLDSIEWDREGTAIPPNVDIEDPLHIVFEAIRLVKDELDELLHERREAEIRIAESERKYRELFEHGTDLLCFHDLDGVVLDSNLAFKKEYGWTDPAEPLPSIPDMIPERIRDQFPAYIERILRSGRDSGHLTLTTPDGPEVILEYDNVLVRDEHGKPIGVNGTARDVSERFRAASEKRALEEQLRHAHRMEAVGTLAGGIAHEFNNVLAVIQGHGELALDDARSGRVNETSLRQVLKSSARGRDLVRKIVAFSGGGDREEAHADLAVEIPAIVRLLERTIPRMVAIDLRLDFQLGPVCASRSQVEQIVVNLALNGADSMPDGGTLTITTAAAAPEEVAVRGAGDLRTGPYARLTVADTGVGIAPDQLRRIYDPFFTTKDIGKGTGLGLSAVYGIVTGLGGSIECTSEPGRGTKFDLFLPLASPEPDKAGNVAVLDEPAAREEGRDRASHQQSVAPGDTRRSAGLAETSGDASGPGGVGLLIDDDELVRDVAARILERLGYRVLAAASGEQALEIYRREAADIDFVLLDLGMPGMGGQKCLKALRELDPEVRVVVASGYAMASARDEAIAGGALQFMTKPYRVADLSRVLREVLSTPR